ncbi:MAG: GGDEF domain-containing protein [Clostridiales bacterium]|nr:GGDEF domain-containing protein [Clostridiales bacterium]
MNILAGVEVGFIGVIVLAVLFFYSKHTQKSSGSFLMDQRLFQIMLITNAAMLVFDMAMLVLNGQSFLFARQLNITATFMFFLVNPVLPLVWILYADYSIYASEAHIKKMIWLYSVPLAVHSVLCVLSLFNGFFFRISPDNLYSRGPFQTYILSPLICFSYLIIPVVMMLFYRKSLADSSDSLNSYYALLLFPLPPLIGGIIQIIYPPVALVWMCTVLSILILFINVQNAKILTDHLTGLYNRRQLEAHIDWKLKKITPPVKLVGIMLDINRFKSINDTFGHDVGDRAIEQAGDILRNSLRRGDFVARYGGDEFVIVLEVTDIEKITRIIERIKNNCAVINSAEDALYKINFSIGCKAYDGSEKVTLREFLTDIDREMYLDKKRSYEEENTSNPA